MHASISFKRLALGAAVLASLTSLASCGGNDNGTAPPVTSTTPSNMPPASAAASPDGFIAYLKVLVATPQDMAQPLDLTGFVAPTSDTTAPDPTI